MAKAPQRTIRLERPPDDRGVGVFAIATGKRTHWYAFREIPCEIGGRGFAIHKLGLGNVYYVRVGKVENSSCECMGYLRHHHCKHIAGLRALIRAGKL